MVWDAERPVDWSTFREHTIREFKEGCGSIRGKQWKLCWLRLLAGPTPSCVTSSVGS